MAINCSPGALLDAASCFNCLDSRQLRMIQTHLLCRLLANEASVNCTFQSGEGSPVGSKTPAFIGQLYHNTTDDTYWRSTGMGNADWTSISGGGPCSLIWGPSQTTITNFKSPGLSNIGTTYDFPLLVTDSGYLNFQGDTKVASASFPSLTTVGGTIDFSSCANLVTLSLPELNGVGGQFIISGSGVLVNLDVGNLKTVQSNFQAVIMGSLATLDLHSLVSIGGISDLEIATCPVLSSINLDSLVSTGGTLTINDCAVLTDINLPSLTTVADFTIQSNPSLSTIYVPNWVPTDGTFVICPANALDATSVELILRRCVLAGVTTCTIHFSGGTNAGLLSLSAQGQSDYAALALAGNAMSINP